MNAFNKGKQILLASAILSKLLLSGCSLDPLHINNSYLNDSFDNLYHHVNNNLILDGILEKNIMHKFEKEYIDCKGNKIESLIVEYISMTKQSTFVPKFRSTYLYPNNGQRQDIYEITGNIDDNGNYLVELVTIKSHTDSTHARNMIDHNNDRLADIILIEYSKDMPCIYDSIMAINQLDEDPLLKKECVTKKRGVQITDEFILYFPSVPKEETDTFTQEIETLSYIFTDISTQYRTMKSRTKKRLLTTL